MGPFNFARPWRFASAAAAALLLVGTVGVLPAQAANPAADIDQCGNGGVGDPDEQCILDNWVNGNLGASKAHYREGQSVPYRIKFSNLASAGTHTVQIQWDTTKGGKHALDYLTTYDRTETDAAPCSEVPGCSPASFSTFPIPADGTMTARPDWQPGAVQVPGVFTLFGGTITGVSAYGYSGSWAGDGSAGITLSFTTAVANPVLAWAGHIASRADWGPGSSAVTISGSPYHMRLLDLDGSGGNQDRSLSSEAVISPASLTVMKNAAPEGATSFGFTSTGGQLPATFSLVDDGDASDSLTVSGITTFGTHTVVEAPTPGWTLSALACTDSSGGTTASTATRTATIALAEGDDVVCTFSNTRNASITVVKEASTDSVPEPGGDVTFHVAVTNDSTVLDVTIASLTDSIYGNIAVTGGDVVSTTCSVPLVVLPGATANCSFVGHVNGNAGDQEIDVVTATGADELGNPVSDSDDATVEITDLAPAIVVDKTANKPSFPEPGGLVTYTVTVTNPGTEAIYLDSLVDDRFGDLDDNGTCDADGQAIAPGASYSCSFAELVTGNAGDTHVNVVTAVAHDDDGNDETDSDDARVDITDLLPNVEVSKTADRTSIPEPGGPVSFTVTVTNPEGAVEPIYLTALVDDIYGDLDDKGTCDADGQAILHDRSYTCSFTETVTGDGGFEHVNTVEATVRDDEGNEVANEDDATVLVSDVEPRIVVDKTAGAATVHTGEAVAYTYKVTNPGVEALTDVVVTDDKCAPVAFSGGDADGDDRLDTGETWTYTCSARLTGTTINTATASGEDDEGNTVSSTDTAKVDVLDPRITIDKTAGNSSVDAGTTVAYTYVVTNPGNTPLSGVVVVDDKCTPVSFSGGDSDGDGLLDVGETWRFACSATLSGAGPVTNIGTVVGRDVSGKRVEADDRATVEVVSRAEVLGVLLPTPVPPAPAAPTPAPAPLGLVTLPVTGAQALRLVQAAAVLVGLGGLLLLGSRRRRNPQGS